MKKALLIIDVQNDFLPGGVLAVPRGDEIIPIINALQEQFDLIIATKDWHPKNHISFVSKWPKHCVQNTYGAEFPPSLNTSKIAQVIYKGSDPDSDSYSAFEDTELAAFLIKKEVEEISVVGLATDFCVKDSVLDALELGFQVILIQEGCRGIGDTQAALAQMRQAGAIIK